MIYIAAIIIALFNISLSFATQSIDYNQEVSAYHALQTLRVIVNDVAHKKDDNAQQRQIVQATAITPLEQPELPLSNWQDIFFRAHHNSGQHFLICASDKELFKDYLGALVRLMQVNSHCRVTFVTDDTELDEFRRKLYILIREHVKCNDYVLRNLHVISQPFKNQPGERQFALNSLQGEKYSAILLACPRPDYLGPLNWLRNQNAVLYVPYSRNPDDIISKLKKSGSVKLSVAKAKGMICTSTSDLTKFLLTGGCLVYRESSCPPIDITEVRDYLRPHDCKIACQFSALSPTVLDTKIYAEEFAKLSNESSSINSHL